MSNKNLTPHTIFKHIGKSLFFITKIFVYLLVVYSILFSLSITVAGFWAKSRVDNFVSSVKSLKFNNPDTTSFMRYYIKKSENSSTKINISRKFIPIDKISPLLIKSTIACEDASFYTHPGINIESIISALETNKKRGRKAFGGSTITQQIAKNIFLTPEKTYIRKLKELTYTLLMERYLSKKRILELYLNYVQWGPDIFGCEAASRKYFKKSSSDLTLNESVRLASVLANPVRYNPWWRKSRLLSQRRRIIYENLYTHRDINIETFEKLTGGSLPRTVRDSIYRVELKSVSDTMTDSISTK